jgi:hypothetical protein
MNEVRQSESKQTLPKIKTYSVNYQLVIDRPVHIVFERMINYHDWNPEHIGARVERLAGERNQLGEIILEFKKKPDGYEAPMLIETVKLVRNKQIVWAFYTPPNDNPTVMSFVDFSLREEGGKTVFEYNLYGSIKDLDGTYNVDRGAFEQSILTRLNEVLPALKAHVENM